jgi:hypothetical protein
MSSYRDLERPHACALLLNIANEDVTAVSAVQPTGLNHRYSTGEITFNARGQNPFNYPETFYH